MSLVISRVLFIVAVLALCVGFLFGVACSNPAESQETDHRDLVPDEPTHADLDGDGDLEEILLDATDGSLSITDGAVSYRSRAKWRVFQAALGDTDHNGLTEVVTLLDSEHGRHLGLFAYFGGEYRERLVTQTISPAPLSIEIIEHGQVLLVQEPIGGQEAPQLTLLRWNGFGFTRVDTATDL
jgi:hypothetical protein